MTKYLEIISLRASSGCEQQARQHMRKFCRVVKKRSLLEADFYVNALIPGDLAIVISSSAKTDKDQAMGLGVFMSDVMKRFGLVDHTCWIMTEDQQILKD